MKSYYIFGILLLMSIHPTIYAQKCVNPNVETHRIDFRDLGYPAATEIPADDSPISALLAHTSEKVYGATSGKQSYLFVNDFMTNKVYPLGRLPKSQGVHHCLVEGSEGKIYIGTGLNELEIFPLTRNIPYGRRSIENQLWEDIKNRYRGYEGGHLYLYDPSTGNNNVYLPNAEAQVTDLGIPVTGNSIYTITMNPSKSKIYGITYPDALFFEYDLETKSIRQYGEWMNMKSYPGPERCWRALPRSLVCTADGRVYSSGDNGLIYYFEPETKKIHSTTMRIPGEYWETQNYNGFPVVEQLVLLNDSCIVGSSSDGFLFAANMKKQKISVYGKPRVERRVRAMTLGTDQRIYLICGEKDNVCRLFSYDLSERREGFLDYGVLGVDRSPYYAKIGYQFDAMCTAADGTIFIGESDRRAKLFYYIPGGNIVKGALNPTNPR